MGIQLLGFAQPNFLGPDGGRSRGGGGQSQRDPDTEKGVRGRGTEMEVGRAGELQREGESQGKYIQRGQSGTVRQAKAETEM